MLQVWSLEFVYCVDVGKGLHDFIDVVLVVFKFRDILIVLK